MKERLSWPGVALAAIGAGVAIAGVVFGDETLTASGLAFFVGIATTVGAVKVGGGKSDG